METIGSILEWLTKYGVIDIFFGLGILAYIRDKFRKKAVRSIDGVEIIPSIRPEDGVFEISVRNVSRDALYIYRAHFRPGYEISRFDRTTIGSAVRSLIYLTWVNDILPRFGDLRNTEGEYILLGNTKVDEDADSVFLEPKQEVSYYLGFEPELIEPNKDIHFWDGVFQARRAGRLTFHYVHGSNGGLLETQI